jgi:hypothetical protein
VLRPELRDRLRLRPLERPLACDLREDRMTGSDGRDDEALRLLGSVVTPLELT